MTVSRRSLLLASTAAPAAGALAGIPTARAAEGAGAGSGRRTVPLRDGWRFALVNPGVRGSRLRLTLTSAHPGEARGAIRISRLEAPAT
ncbi:hypothetical protein ACIP4S_24970 [Streptomyces chartreusis]|uniref:hypothetical protein n=1 Tax=Streptomyces chartreusis TaxID=1969 RepID=UPI00380C1B6B